MNAWIGAAIAAAVTIVALVLDPELLLGNSAGIKVGFTISLLGIVGLAFHISRQTRETNISRHIASWSSALAVMAIVASNMNLLTSNGQIDQNQTVVANATAPVVTKANFRRQHTSREVYVPDTAKINRVEAVVTREQTGFGFQASADERTFVKNQFSEQNSRLDQDWKLSSAEKQKFEKFLQSQGLKYDPETAFVVPGTSAKPAS